MLWFVLLNFVLSLVMSRSPLPKGLLLETEVSNTKLEQFGISATTTQTQHLKQSIPRSSLLDTQMKLQATDPSLSATDFTYLINALSFYGNWYNGVNSSQVLFLIRNPLIISSKGESIQPEIRVCNNSRARSRQS